MLGKYPQAVNSTHLLSVADSTSTLLSVTTSKLVANLGCLGSAHTNLTKLVAIIVDGQHYLVDDTILTASHEHAYISLTVPGKKVETIR